jgi:competence protein ComEC
MVWSACLALALVCLTQVMPWLPVLLPELAAAGALLVLFLWGPRYGLVVLPVIWAVLHAQWVIDDRLVPALAGQDILLHGTVCEFPDSDPGVHRFVLAPDSAALPGLPQRIFLSWYDAADAPQGGQSWALKVRLKRPRGLSNPGAFDFEKWALARQIGATGYVRESALNRQTVGDVRACPLMRMRQHIAMRMEAALAESAAAGHLLAVSVGMRNNLTDVQWGLLRRTGTVHLMAISGLHIRTAIRPLDIACRDSMCAVVRRALVGRGGCRCLQCAGGFRIADRSRAGDGIGRHGPGNSSPHYTRRTDALRSAVCGLVD